MTEMAHDLSDKIAALRRVLDDPRPWDGHVKGWTRDQFIARVSELEDAKGTR